MDISRLRTSAVPQPQRRRWLKQLADRLDGDKAKQRHAARMQRCRAPSPSPPFSANPDCIGRRVSAANPFANISASVQPSRSAGSRFGQYEDRMPTHGYEPTGEAAMAAFREGFAEGVVLRSGSPRGTADLNLACGHVTRLGHAARGTISN